MYAIMIEETDTIIPSQGDFPVLMETDGRSRNHEDRAMRKETHAMC